MQRRKYSFWTHQPVYRRTHRITSFFFNALGKLESYGSENVPPHGGVLLVSNHVSLPDPVIIGTAVNRELHFMARHNLFRVPGLRWLIAALNAYPVHRGKADRTALKYTLSLLKTGNAVLIFPEGTRGAGGVLGKALGGASFIVYRANVPTIPVFLKGAEQMMPRNAKWLRPAKLNVTFGPPIDFTGILKIADKREAHRRIGEQIMQSISNLRDIQTHQQKGVLSPTKPQYDCGTN